MRMGLEEMETASIDNSLQDWFLSSDWWIKEASQDFRLQIGLPDLANTNAEHLAKLEFLISR